jgi:hypothetical protein
VSAILKSSPAPLGHRQLRHREKLLLMLLQPCAHQLLHQPQTNKNSNSHRQKIRTNSPSTNQRIKRQNIAYSNNDQENLTPLPVRVGLVTALAALGMISFVKHRRKN